MLPRESLGNKFYRATILAPLLRPNRCLAWHKRRERRPHARPLRVAWRGATLPSESESSERVPRSASRHRPHSDQASGSPGESSREAPQAPRAKLRHQFALQHKLATTLAAPGLLASIAGPRDCHRPEEYEPCESLLSSVHFGCDFVPLSLLAGTRAAFWLSRRYLISKRLPTLQQSSEPCSFGQLTNNTSLF